MTLQFLFSNDLADEPALQPFEGFRYRPALISPADEAELVARVRELPFREFEFHGYTGKRRVASFGWQYDFSGRQLRKAADIPDFLLGLRSLAGSFAGLEPADLKQALVTEYGPSAGIGWHRDKAVFGQVVGISLLTPCVLRFRRKINPKPQWGDEYRTGSDSDRAPGLKAERVSAKRLWERVNVLAEPRSAYHLSGPARLKWEHSILRVDELRYSITFRSLRAE